jgi:hypothetical protein
MPAIHRPSTLSLKLRLALTIGVGLACAAAAHAQIYKCVDAAGRITYQQSPCPSTQTGSRVEVKTDNGSTREVPEEEPAWSVAARTGELSPGMSKRWVQQALGAPLECRPGQPDEKASEVCLFETVKGRLRTGLNNGAVVWWRKDGTNPGPATPDATNPSSPRQPPGM